MLFFRIIPIITHDGKVKYTIRPSAWLNASLEKFCTNRSIRRHKAGK